MVDIGVATQAVLPVVAGSLGVWNRVASSLTPTTPSLHCVDTGVAPQAVLSAFVGPFCMRHLHSRPHTHTHTHTHILQDGHRCGAAGGSLSVGGLSFAMGTDTPTHPHTSHGGEDSRMAPQADSSTYVGSFGVRQCHPPPSPPPPFMAWTLAWRRRRSSQQVLAWFALGTGTPVHTHRHPPSCSPAAHVLSLLCDGD